MTVGTLIVIAKQPLPGKVKTRLITRDAVSAADAARLAEASLQDTVANLAGVDSRRRVLLIEGTAPAWLPADWDVIAQSGGGLDERLANGFAAVDGDSAVLVGMDTPQVDPALLDCDLERYDSCLGLAYDGGYWSIGFARPALARSVISGVPMSRSDTGSCQLARLAAAGMSVQRLATLTDVDTPASADQVSAEAPDARFSRLWRELGSARHLRAETVQVRS